MGDFLKIRVKKRNLFILLAFVLVLAGFFVVYDNYDSSDFLPSVSSADYSVDNGLSEDKIDIHINEGSYSFLDSVETQVYSYNEQFPGPLIIGKSGTTKEVTVYNDMDEPTTVHWHGLQLSNIDDGVPQVTQEPIMPGKSFKYEVELRNPGLYWYHSHVDAGKQIESGLQGVILVTNDSEIDEGNVLVLDDILVDNSYQFRDFDLGVMHGRYGNVLLVNGKINPEINLTNNRLRIVNTANARSFNIQFEGKEFTVIGQDIGFSNHYNKTILTINPGERYDILLPKDIEENIKLEYVTSQGYYDLAKLNYGGSYISLDEFGSFSAPFNLSEALNKEPDFNVYLKGFMGGHMGLIWSINGKYYPDNPEIFEVDEGDLVKFRITNTQGQPHPMHLHGQKFIVLSRNGVPETDIGWKDVVMVNGGETVDILFKAEDKGDWVFHCHILEHAEAGMLSIVRVN